jgi:hypothetical protein
VAKGFEPLETSFSRLNRKAEIFTCDNTQRVDFTPPEVGFPSYFPSVVSYHMITASIDSPFYTKKFVQ